MKSLVMTTAHQIKSLFSTWSEALKAAWAKVKNKMKLTIETNNQDRAEEIENAFDLLKNKENIVDCFKNNLEVFETSSPFMFNNTSNYVVGKAGSHVWIADRLTGNRLAIITNI